MKQSPHEEKLKEGDHTKKVAFGIVLEGVLIFGVLSLYFIFLSHQRLVGRDEGFYLYAAQLVMQGYLPYVDFFYPQMPYLPYIYGIWMELFGYDWYAARSFTAVLSAASGLLVFKLGLLIVPRSWAYLALFLFGTSNFVVPWFLTAQTYSLSVLLFLISLYLVLLNKKNISGLVFLSGVFFALAGGVRLFFLGLLPVLLLAMFLTKTNREQWRQLILKFSGGAILGALPILLLLSYSFDLFWFNNMGYHVMRSDGDFSAELQRKFSIFLALAGLREVRAYTAFQFPLLLYGTLLSGLILLWTGRLMAVPTVILLAGLSLLLISFLPHPCYLQYFSASAPFFMLSGVYLLRSGYLALNNIGKGKKYLKCLYMTAVVGLVLIYSYGVPTDYKRYSKTGYGVMGIRNEENAAEWNLKTITEVTEVVRQHAEDTQIFFSFWPGYFLGTEAQLLRGSENHFGVNIAERLSQENQAKYNVIDEEQIEAALRQSEIAYVIIRGKKQEKLLEDSGYQPKREWGSVKFFERGTATHEP